MKPWLVALVVVGVMGSATWAEEQLSPVLAGIDFALWADTFEAQMDVLSVLPPAERQTQFVDYMREWRDELMPVMFAVRMLPPEQRAELGRRVRSAILTEVGVERAAELQGRWQEEMQYQRDAFLALDAEGRQALLRRFWTPGEAVPVDPLKKALGVSDAEWDVISDLISRIRKVQQEEAQARQEHRRVLTRLLQDQASDVKAFVAEFKAMAEKAHRFQKQLADLRNELRQLVTTKQEVILVLQDILD